MLCNLNLDLAPPKNFFAKRHWKKPSSWRLLVAWNGSSQPSFGEIHFLLSSPLKSHPLIPYRHLCWPPPCAGRGIRLLGVGQIARRPEEGRAAPTIRTTTSSKDVPQHWREDLIVRTRCQPHKQAAPIAIRTVPTIAIRRSRLQAAARATGEQAVVAGRLVSNRRRA